MKFYRIFLIAVALGLFQAGAALAQTTSTLRANYDTKGRRLPNQGAMRNGQTMYDWMGGAGDIWWDGGSPLHSLDAIKDFLYSRSSDAIKSPRPKKVKLYMQGYVPRLWNTTYEEAAANDEKFRKGWMAIAQLCVDAGYKDVVFGSSETQRGTKPWEPTADDVRSGRWKKAWINMANDVRAVMPGAKFAFVPLSGGQDGEYASPDNKIDEKDYWYAEGKDKEGRPYMDYWGMTFYFGTHGANWPVPRPVTNEIIDKSMASIRTPVKNCHTNWGFVGNANYAKEKGIKMVIGEMGMFDRLPEVKYGMGDQPYAVEQMTQLMADYSDVIEFVCWFNMKNDDALKKNRKRFWDRMDGFSSMPHAAKRAQELWGPDSPYRR